MLFWSSDHNKNCKGDNYINETIMFYIYIALTLTKELTGCDMHAYEC